MPVLRCTFIDQAVREAILPLPVPFRKGCSEVKIAHLRNPTVVAPIQNLSPQLNFVAYAGASVATRRMCSNDASMQPFVQTLVAAAIEGAVPFLHFCPLY